MKCISKNIYLPIELIDEFLTKMSGERPYMKPFIFRVFCFNRERFSSFSRYCTRLSVGPYFLTVLHRAVSTKAVNIHFVGTPNFLNDVKQINECPFL